MISAIVQWLASVMGALKLPLTGAAIVSGFKKILSLGFVGVIWAVLLVIALDIITPPYVIGSTDGIIAAIIAPAITLFGVPYIAAFAIALGALYVIAALFIIISFFVV